MKLVSPFQRGSTCTCRWPGHAGARGPAQVRADVDAVGLVRRPDRLQRPQLRARDVAVLVVGQIFVARNVAHRRDHEVSRAVRIQVHHRDRRRRAFEHERFGVVGRGDEIAHHAAEVVAAGVGIGDVAERQSAQIRSSMRRACATTAASRSTKSSTLTSRSGSSLPRAFTPTVPLLDVAVADDEDVRHLLGLRLAGCGRRACPPEPSTISARNPSAFKRSTTRNAYVVVTVADGQHGGLHRREPRRERTRVVLDQHAEEPLDRTEQRAVDHDRRVPLVVGTDVVDAEALRRLEVELDRRHLPGAADRVLRLHADLRARRTRRRLRRARVRGSSSSPPRATPRSLRPTPRRNRPTSRAGLVDSSR